MRKYITIKSNGKHYYYRWTSSDKLFCKREIGVFSDSFSKIGTASSLEDAIALAKAMCGAGKDANIELKDAT